MSGSAWGPERLYGDTVVQAAGTSYRIVVDPVYGYRRLDPLPAAAELADFYRNHYREMLGSGRRAPELARLLDGGADAAREREWRSGTIHADVLAALEEARSRGLPSRVLDIGCGTGELLRDLTSAGWEAFGIEPTTELAAFCRANGLSVVDATAESYLEDWREKGGAPFGAIVLLNVLEHVPNPELLLAAAGGTLGPEGRVVVRVPNDFSPLQQAALQALGGAPWWIAVPDHVNYFDHASIARLLEMTGFEVVERSADFPMELFLLMGFDYRDDPVVGAEVHRRRQQTEMALSPSLRRALGRAWATIGIGRNAFVVGRRT